MAVGLVASGVNVVAVVRPRRDPAITPIESESLLRIEADVTDEADCERVVEATLRRFGSLDGVVNNAALSHEFFPLHHESAFPDVQPDLWRKVFDVNVNGPFCMTRAAIPTMLERGWGRIVNISTSRSTMVAASVLPYGPSKAALSTMTGAWAARLQGTGVTVNEVLPGGPTGPPDADKHWRQDGALSWPVEIIVPPVQFLLSPAADGVTGMRVVARLWDPELPPALAVLLAGTPVALPLGPDDHALPPTVA